MPTSSRPTLALPQNRPDLTPLGKGGRGDLHPRLPWIPALTLAALALFPSAAQASLARIISVQGSVEVQRATGTTFQPAFPGTALYGPDILRPRRGSRVMVVCPNGQSQWRVPAGTVSAVNNGCPGTPAALKPEFGVGDLRGGSDPAIPYVIAPRQDLVLSPTPTLQWNPVEGATQYTVSLRTRRGTLWEVTTPEATLPYPENQPPLSPGTRYTLVVEADTGAASTDEPPELAFNLLGGDEATEAAQQIAAVQALDLTELARTLILIEEVYPRYQLTAAAIADLETLISHGFELAQVRRLLGDIHLRSGLSLLAEANYLRAIALATATDNLEEQVMAQYGLGTLYRHTGNAEGAMEQLAAAQAGAEALGNATLAADIANERQPTPR
ncbi:MAG: tetratricopeptide repeat protein [Leptolyngbya sp.]|nr:tetratricopeptide repeat protein [Leptolyngbya sp.]